MEQDLLSLPKHLTSERSAKYKKGNLNLKKNTLVFFNNTKFKTVQYYWFLFVLKLNISMTFHFYKRFDYLAGDNFGDEVRYDSLLIANLCHVSTRVFDQLVDQLWNYRFFIH